MPRRSNFADFSAKIRKKLFKNLLLGEIISIHIENDIRLDSFQVNSARR